MMNQLVYKQITKNLMKKKESLFIVWLVTAISAFIYFFVQISIDGNVEYAQGLADKQLLVALRSNTVLARVFLISFLFILLFLYYMFYNRFIRDESKQMGCYGMLGFPGHFLRRTYMSIYVIAMITGTTVGLFLGYETSGILLANYEVSYDLRGLVRGLSLPNLLLGYCFPLIVIGVFMHFMIAKFTKKEVNDLLNYKDSKSPGVMKFSNIISGCFRGKLAYGMRIAFRKPVAILLILGSVFTFNILFLFSISLNQSSSIVLNSQLEGRNFVYRAELEEIRRLKGKRESTDPKADFQLKESGNLVKNKDVIAQNIVGVEENSQFFELYSLSQSDASRQRKSVLPKDGEIIIGPRIHEIYHIGKGDKVILEIDGKQVPVTVGDIARNADNNGVYMKKENLENILGLKSGSFNIILSEQKPELKDAKILTMSQIEDKLEGDNVSNRLSAVICQVLAIVVGTLLLFAAILLNFEENFASIIKLTILGYRSKEINNMLISIYTPIIIIGFCLLVYPSILIGRGISAALSLQTGDYMPFYTNPVIIVIGFLAIEAIYFCIKWLFSKKVEKFIKGHDLANGVQ